MYLTHLSLTNFRNYARLDVAVPPGPVLMVGDNAQGKTSLLEAIYFLATFVSFHASQDRQLIRLGAQKEPLAVARIVAAFHRHEPGSAGGAGKTHHLEVRIISENNQTSEPLRTRKEVLLDGVKLKAQEAVGAFNAVLFLPQMLQVIEGSPDDRRRYLNLAMSQAIPHFSETLANYQQILSQRNALLKQISERGLDLAAASSQLTYWDERLARSGSEIMLARIKTIADLERLAAGFHHRLTHGGEVLRLAYQPSFEPVQAKPGQFQMRMETEIDRTNLTVEKIELKFRENLERARLEELARGVTTIGPHRDELRFKANQVDLGTFGSRGQARTAVLALKLAEVAWMREETSEWPVLLLDEVLAELDPQRRADLQAQLLDSEQVLMTTTDLEHFPAGFTKAARIWQIQAGQILKEVTGQRPPAKAGGL